MIHTGLMLDPFTQVSIGTDTDPAFVIFTLLSRLDFGQVLPIIQSVSSIH